jgi:hypothetical protein
MGADGTVTDLIPTVRLRLPSPDRRGEELFLFEEYLTRRLAALPIFVKVHMIPLDPPLPWW